MTLGTGIFASTVLVLLAVALWYITKQGWWKRVGVGLGILIGLPALIALGAWGWTEYANRPTPQQSLDRIALGMTPVEVKLLKGEPQGVSLFTCGRPLSDPIKERRLNELTDEELLLATKLELAARMPGTHCGPDTGETRERWSFPNMDIVFNASNNGSKVSSICHYRGAERLIGVSSGTPESDVLAELGKPTLVSIRSDGLAKQVSYRQWNVAFEFEKGRVSTMCVAEGDVRYPAEYGSSTILDSK